MPDQSKAKPRLPTSRAGRLAFWNARRAARKQAGRLLYGELTARVLALPIGGTLTVKGHVQASAIDGVARQAGARLTRDKIGGRKKYAPHGCQTAAHKQAVKAAYRRSKFLLTRVA